MKALTWYYPTSLEEAAELVRQPNVAPHGGGTGLLRTGIDRFSALIDLQRLPLKTLELDGDTVEIGASLTYAQVIEGLRDRDPQSILLNSLSRAAATGLRNRITIGGSAAMAPIWSDLLGPLIALDAEVSLVGAHEGWFRFSAYVNDRELHQGTLVTGIRFQRNGWQGRYVRAAATQFDYASFSLTLLLKKQDDGTIEDARLVVVGNKKRFSRLTAQEDQLKGQRIDVLDPGRIAAGADVEFADKTIGSAGYVRYLFGVEFERALEAM